MDFESKIISREVSQLLWEMEKTVGTAESCTGGRIAEAIIAIPGASKYFKGGIISYVDEIKESLLGVDSQVLIEKTAVCEEVAMQMVKGACKAGTIWLACGTQEKQVTMMIQEDHGRDINLAIATNKVMQMFLDFLKTENKTDGEG